MRSRCIPRLPLRRLFIRATISLPILTLCATVYGGSVSDFGRFQVILDRKPFGSRAEAAPASEATGPQAGSLRISAIVEGVDGIRVGLIDLQGNGSLFLKVGETENGILVVAADPVKEEAIVRRGNESFTLRMEGGAPRTPESVAPPPPTRTAIAPVPVERELLTKQRRELALARIQARRDAAMRAQGETGSNLIQKITGPELEKRLQEYQLEVIRRGEPPLPIPLTPEMDEQLVKEGVLQPQ